MRALAAEFAALAREEAEALGGAARDRVDEIYNSAREHMEGAFERAQTSADDAYEFVRDQWRERPLTVAGTALGIGLLLGLALGSRR
jgi:ElaB/YqjD/DUF883 family membrane-anchored ribosome-binding protein